METNNIDWSDIKQKYQVGHIIIGKVEYHARFGIFIDLGHPIIKGIIEIIEFLDEGVMSEALYPPIGELISSVVIGYSEGDNQIRMSLKPSRLINAIP